MLDLTTAASTLAVSVADAKDHMRVNHSSEDDLISAYIQAATEQAEHVTGRAIMSQTWTLALSCFPERIHVPKPPFQSVSSFKYVSTSGVLTTLQEDTNYSIYNQSGNRPALVYPVYGTDWPDVRDETPNAVRLVYVAGWSDAADVPPGIVQAIKLMTAELFERREESVSASINRVPLAAHSLLAPWCVYSPVTT
jgi:uncharacterized phiE125 gp8 family phage protein